MTIPCTGSIGRGRGEGEWEGERKRGRGGEGVLYEKVGSVRRIAQSTLLRPFSYGGPSPDPWR